MVEKDKQYSKWLMTQPWFSIKHKELYNELNHELNNNIDKNLLKLMKKNLLLIQMELVKIMVLKWRERV